MSPYLCNNWLVWALTFVYTLKSETERSFCCVHVHTWGVDDGDGVLQTAQIWSCIWSPCKWEILSSLLWLMMQPKSESHTRHTPTSTPPPQHTHRDAYDIHSFYTSAHTYMHTHTLAHIHICMHTHTTHKHTYTCTYILYAHKHTYTHTHTHTYTEFITNDH